MIHLIMKRFSFYTFSIFLFLHSTSFGQSNIYHPFPPSGALWTTADVIPGCLDNPCDYVYDVFGGDTTIDNLNYHKLYEGGTSFGPGGPYYSAPEFAAIYVRDDTANKKVFIRFAGLSLEILLYDFGLNVGDTLPDAYTSAKVAGVFITAIDSILLEDNTYRRRLKLNSVGYVSVIDSLSLIEGIGYTGGLLRPILPDHFEGGSHLACFNNSLVTEYNFPAFGLSECKLMTDIVETSAQPIQIFPVPVSRGTNLTFSGISVDDPIIFYDVFGNVVQSFHLSSASLNIPTSMVPGIYFCKILINAKGITLIKTIIVQ
jgi:hypothetical protein